MRRQKRNMNDRAFQRGYQAGISGRSHDACPHENGASRQQWVNGWREGRIDHLEGYTGVAGVHKMAAH